LCLLGKLFIESKTAYLNVDEFFFYVLTEYTPAGYNTIAYFSKVRKHLIKILFLNLVQKFQTQSIPGEIIGDELQFELYSHIAVASESGHRSIYDRFQYVLPYLNLVRI